MACGTIGVIGLGFLGSAISHRLIEASFGVVGFDIDPQKIVAAANVRAVTVEQMAEHCRAIVLVVFSHGQAAEIIHACSKHVSAKSEPGPTLICCTTCPPESINELALIAAKNKLSFIEYPISGTASNVAQGDSLGLAGGDKALVDEHADILAGICPDWAYLGGIGSASSTKLSINLVLQLNRIALAEGLIFAESQGLDTTLTLDAFQRSAARSSVMATKGPKMVSQDFSPQSHLSTSLKDVSIMCDIAERNGIWLPLLESSAQLHRLTEAHLGGAVDPAACVEGLRMGARAHQSDSSVLMRMEKMRCEALEAADLETLDSLLDKDLVYVHSSGRVDSKNELITSIQAGNLRYDLVRTENVEIKTSGSAAIMSGEIAMEVLVQGTPKPLHNSFMSTWVNRGGMWYLLSYSAMPLLP